MNITFDHYHKYDEIRAFLQECVRWWDEHLKGEPTGIMEEPMLRAWMQEAVEPRVDALGQTLAFLEAHRDQSGIIYCMTRKLSLIHI